jgi:collagenase-like PrtC family protease
MKKIELLAPVGSLANLKAAIVGGADSVYLGMNKFSARNYATNFNDNYLKQAINLCKSNKVKLYLTMNTLVKNDEIEEFFKYLSYAYSCGIDSVIIQDISLLRIIKDNFPDLKVHLSTQAGIMNSFHANLLKRADRINLARELKKSEIQHIRNNFRKELEVFVHGALCVCLSGSCLFSSFLGGRSGNRGRCAQPCRKKYDGCYYLSTKELCLAKEIPSIVRSGVDSVKIEGRMRSPYYVNNTVSIYGNLIDDYYKGRFKVTDEILKKLESGFSREFTQGNFSSECVFNRKTATGTSEIVKRIYEVKSSNFRSKRESIKVKLPPIESKESKKQLLVRVYNREDALIADSNGADVIYLDIYDNDFSSVKSQIKCKLFAVTPRLMFDSDTDEIKKLIDEKKPDGILAGNLGVLGFGLNIPIHLDYNINCFNDLDLDYYGNVFPLISPELNFKELSNFKNKNFGVLVHGKIRLMSLRHELKEGWIKDEKDCKFLVFKVKNGSEIINEKELGFFNKCNFLIENGLKSFFIDTDNNVSEIVSLYRSILDGKKVNDSKIRKKYVLGWSFKGVQ